jgi:hypothetical protein
MSLNMDKIRTLLFIPVLALPVLLMLGRALRPPGTDAAVPPDPRRYRWCRLCEKASLVDGFWAAFCPVCGGGNALPGDFMDWGDFLRHHPDSPLVPQLSVTYPLTSPTARRELAALRRDDPL